MALTGKRASKLVRAPGPEAFRVLGDTLHSRVARGTSAPAFVRWRAQHGDVGMVLVRGNHDRYAGDPPAEWRIDCIDEPYAMDTIALSHVPRPIPACYAIGGHVHPAAKLVGRAREYVRLPCFLFPKDYAILPAFGPFTGMSDVEPSAADRVYVIAGDSVVAAKA